MLKIKKVNYNIKNFDDPYMGKLLQWGVSENKQNWLLVM